jgi:hypothetical protein
MPSSGACRSLNNVSAPGRTYGSSTGRSHKSAATKRPPSRPRTSRTRRHCATGKTVAGRQDRSPAGMGRPPIVER